MTTVRLALRMKEVADLTGASLTVVKGWCASGRLVTVRPNGPNGVVLVMPADLEAFLQSNRDGLAVAPLRAVARPRRKTA